MIGINQFRLTPAQPRVAQPHRWTTMKSIVCGAALILIGAIAFYELQDVVRAAQFGAFENPNPSLFSRMKGVWVLLMLLLPATLIGLFAVRWAPVLGAGAYVVGFLSHYLYHYVEWKIPPDPIYMHVTLKACLVVFSLGAFGATIAFCVAYLKRRLTIGSSDRGAKASMGQGEGR